MSLLWVRVASYADASPEARERRMDRVKNWVTRQPLKPDYARHPSFEIPDHFGPTAPVHEATEAASGLWEHGHLLGNVHTHHLPWEEVPLDGRLHTSQGTVRPDIVHHKIDAEREPDEDSWPDEGMFDEHDPSDDPMVVRKGGKHYLINGNHRFVEHRLMGKPTMHARVYDADDPKAGPEHCYECGEHKEYCSDCGGTPDWERES